MTSSFSFSPTLPRALAAAALTLAMGAATVETATAMPFRSGPGVAASAALPVETVQYRGRYHGGPVYGRYRGGRNAAVIGGLAALGVLGVAGAVAASQAPAYGYAPGYAEELDVIEEPVHQPYYAPAPVYVPAPAYGYGYPHRHHGWHRGGNRPGGGVDPARGSNR